MHATRTVWGGHRSPSPNRVEDEGQGREGHRCRVRTAACTRAHVNVLVALASRAGIRGPRGPGAAAVTLCLG